ncbi:DUF2218 domain-containing protein [Mesobaculum littorinae]|uniref:DUF2218 domain-containing protein n=1 Tax=Mesobaculum littorinae TaxID=2486419 RepID=A0A438AII9_9RHOB|nr:DUF2218 domain-containing protein [Mesobaculum littorinae]RVV98573.1 DUF2218 domain-containing protein [Mesobaculum littorinae]
MPTATARFETPNARRYLQQVCKHFAHKIEVDYTETEAHCALPVGPATLKADDAGLDMQVEAADAEGLARGEHVLWDHIKRFAFREEPADVVWRETA